MNVVNHQLPAVSVVVPCLNEEQTIQLLLEAVYQQTFPKNRIEVIIVDGLSTDRTRNKIDEFIESHHDLKIQIIDNPEKTIPIALNKAIRAANGEIIVRLDAHSVPYPDYIERGVKLLQEKKGNNVGGIWEIRPGKNRHGYETWISRSIAQAAAHPLGVGDAFYRYAKKPRKVDTVPFGIFNKQLIEEIGYFNEKLLTNEDYEFNVRITRNNGKIWLDPAIRSIYFSRATYPALFRQYWRYGYWKAQMLRNHLTSLKWRQVLPPLFIFLLFSFSFASIWINTARFILGSMVAMYIIILVIVGGSEAIKKKDIAIALGMPIAIGCMHIAWGSGFWWSLIDSNLRPRQ